MGEPFLFGFSNHLINKLTLIIVIEMSGLQQPSFGVVVDYRGYQSIWVLEG